MEREIYVDRPVIIIILLVCIAGTVSNFKGKRSRSGNSQGKNTGFLLHGKRSR